MLHRRRMASCSRLAMIAVTLATMTMTMTGCGKTASTSALRYQFHKNAEHTYQVNGTLQGTISSPSQAPGEQAMEMPVEGQLIYTIPMRVIATDGQTATLEQRITEGEALVEVSGQRLGGPIPEAKLTFKMDTHGNISDVQGLDSLSLDNEFLNARHFREMMTQVLPLFPKENAPKVGDSWVNEVSLDIPGSDQPVNVQVTVKYLANETLNGRRVAKLEQKAKIPVNMTRNTQRARITIKGDDLVESISFVDVKTGFPVTTETNILYTADQVIEMEGRRMAMRFDLATAVTMEEMQQEQKKR